MTNILKTCRAHGTSTQTASTAVFAGNMLPLAFAPGKMARSILYITSRRLLKNWQPLSRQKKVARSRQLEMTGD